MEYICKYYNCYFIYFEKKLDLCFFKMKNG